MDIIWDDDVHRDFCTRILRIFNYFCKQYIGTKKKRDGDGGGKQVMLNL